MEESAWVRSFSNVFNLKRDSTDSGMILLEKLVSTNLGSRLGVSEDAQEMVNNADKIDFDIFDFKAETKSNELVVFMSMVF